MALKLSLDNARRAEPAVDEDHHHVWYDTGGLALICQSPRFGTRQAARAAAIRHGMIPEQFLVMKCRLPCRCIRKRKRKPRKPCRHCGKR